MWPEISRNSVKEDDVGCPTSGCFFGMSARSWIVDNAGVKGLMTRFERMVVGPVYETREKPVEGVQFNTLGRSWVVL